MTKQYSKNNRAHEESIVIYENMKAFHVTLSMSKPLA
jgi:hypothetical protein